MIVSKERSAWSCFSSVDDVSAVTPYTDVLGVKYAYDSTVANHKNIHIGDLLLLRDEILIYGHGLVRDVRAEAGVKAMELCPACRNSGPEARRHKLPKYRCSNCKHEFDEQDLLIEERPIQRFEAWYDATWTELPEPLPRAILNAIYAGRDLQNAVRRLEFSSAVELLSGHTTLDGFVDLQGIHPTKTTGTNPAGGHVVVEGRRRLGQQQFKSRLVERFGHVCAVTGPQPAAVLDAAHLYRFADNPDHHVDGGLLLRADMHRLFDAFLLTVNADTWTVELHPDLREIEGLAAVHGGVLRVDEACRPDPAFLLAHAEEAHRRWDDAS